MLIILIAHCGMGVILGRSIYNHSHFIGKKRSQKITFSLTYKNVLPALLVCLAINMVLPKGDS